MEQRPNPYLYREVTCHYFFVRKVLLFKYSYAFVGLPGGFGTLDELCEALTLIQTGKIQNFPVVLIGTEYWAPFMTLLRQMVDQRRHRGIRSRSAQGHRRPRRRHSSHRAAHHRVVRPATRQARAVVARRTVDPERAFQDRCKGPSDPRTLGRRGTYPGTANTGTFVSDTRRSAVLPGRWWATPRRPTATIAWGSVPTSPASTSAGDPTTTRKAGGFGSVRAMSASRLVASVIQSRFDVAGQAIPAERHHRRRHGVQEGEARAEIRREARRGVGRRRGNRR